MRAHQIMTRSVISVAPHTSIVEAANTMLKRHVSGLTVVDDAGKLVGVVSEGDFVRRSEIGTGRKRGRWLRFILGPGASASDFVHEHGRKVSEVMTASVVTITEDTALAEIVDLMERNNVKRLPVVRATRSSASSRAPIYCRRWRGSLARSRIRRPTTITFAAVSSTPWRKTTGARSD